MAKNVGKINIGIGLDLSKFEKALKKVEYKLGRFGRNLKSIGSTMTVGLTLPIAAAGAAFIKMAGDMETLSTQFEILAGDAKKGTAALDEIKKFSAATPFQFDDIAQSSKAIISLTGSTEGLTDRMYVLGNISAATGNNLKEISDIYVKVLGKGKLQAEEINQFSERAVPIIAAVARVMGVAESEVRQLGSEGKITTDIFLKAMDELGGKGGRFGSAMEKLAGTLNGLFSTLKDNLFLLGNEIGTTLADVLQVKDIVGSTIDVVKSATSGFAEFAKTSPGIIKLGAALAAVLAVTGPLIGVVGLLAAALSSMGLVLGGIVTLLGTTVALLGTYTASQLIAERHTLRQRDALMEVARRYQAGTLSVEAYNEAVDGIMRQGADYLTYMDEKAKALKTEKQIFEDLALQAKKIREEDEKRGFTFGISQEDIFNSFQTQLRESLDRVKSLKMGEGREFTIPMTIGILANLNKVESIIEDDILNRKLADAMAAIPGVNVIMGENGIPTLEFTSEANMDMVLQARDLVLEGEKSLSNQLSSQISEKTEELREKMIKEIADATEGVDIVDGVLTFKEGVDIKLFAEHVDAHLDDLEHARTKSRELGQKVGNIVGDAFDDGIRGLVKGDLDFGDLITNMFQEIQIAMLQSALEPLKNSITSMFTNAFSGGMGEATSSAKGIASDSAKDITSTFGSSMESGFQGAFSGISNTVGGLMGGLGDMLGGLLGGIGGGIGGIFSGIGSIFGGFFADGGDPPVGKVSVVGERGPELFVPKGAGTIIPNHELRGSGGGSNYTIHQSFGEGVDARVTSILKQAMPGIIDQAVNQVENKVRRGGSFSKSFRNA